MEPHPHDDGPVERGVGLSMTAAVEAVAACASRIPNSLAASRIEATLRPLVINRRIRSGRAWFDAAHNSAPTLAAAMVTFSFEIALHDVAEHIVIRSSVASVPSDIIEQLTGA